MPPRPSTEQLIASLRRVPYFQQIAEPVLHELTRQAVWREAASGEVIFLEGETAPGMYFLQSGWVKVLKVSPEGREQVVRMLGPGETFNEIGAFVERPNPATAIALEPSTLWVLPRAPIARLLREHPALGQQVIAALAERIAGLVELVADLSLRTVTGRLARHLLDEAVDGVVARPRWYTQAELAARLGTVPDVIQRAMRGLEADRIISVERQQIRILDRTALERLLR